MADLREGPVGERTPRRGEGSAHWRRGLGLLGLVCLAVFLPLLAAGHVFDDDLLILQNTELDSLSRPWRFFVQPLWAGTPRLEPPGLYHRPLMVLSLALDRALFGTAPGPAHLHSLLWHLAAVGGLAALLRRAGLGAGPALLGLVVFALHPIQVEPVAFLSARNDTMAAALVLWGLAGLLRERVRWGAVAASFLGACLSKESALLVVVLVPLLGLLHSELPRRRWVIGGAVAAGAAGLVVLLRLVGGIGSPPLVSLARVVDAAPSALAWWAGVVLWPVDAAPLLHLSWAPEPSWALVLLAALSVAGLALLAGRRGLLGLALIAASLGPALLGVAQTGQVPGRYVYLPLAGLGLLVALAAQGRVRGPWAAAGLGGVLAVLSARQVPVWQSDEALWSTVTERQPSSFSEAALAKTLELEGDREAAAVHYARALDPGPPAAHACWNIARNELAMGDFAGAAAAGQAALDAGCAPDPELVAPAAVGLVAVGRFDDAAALAARVLPGPDPTGLLVLVGLAVELHRGDAAGLKAVAGPNPERQRALAAQVDRLLAAAGDEAARALLRRAVEESGPHPGEAPR